MAMTLCPNCASGYVLPGEPRGSLEDGVYVYRHQPLTKTTSTPGWRALVFFTDILGFEFKNSRIMADAFGERLKCDVFVPDLFNGNPPLHEPDLAPYVPDVPNQNIDQSWLQWIEYALVWIRALPALWFSRPGVGNARGEEFIRKLKSKGIYSKIGLIGYCYGGGVALVTATRPGLVDVVVSCHAGPVDVADMSRAKSPLFMVNSEEDSWLPPAKRDLAEAALRGNKTIESKFVVYPGVVHGFACRPNLGIPQVKASFEKAFEDSVSWFTKYLG